jgi:hypothetical protein
MGAKKPDKGKSSAKQSSPGFKAPRGSPRLKRLSAEHPPQDQRPAKTRVTEKAEKAADPYDPYEFAAEGEVDVNALASIAKRLSSRSGKDTVLKALKVSL